MSEEVCGYSNSETFHAGLFLSNNREPYERALHLARLHRKDETAWDLADDLQFLVEEAILRMDDRQEACQSDSEYLAHTLLSAAVGRINWKELAEEWLSVSVHDLADQCFADWFEDGVTPEQAARLTLEDEGFPFEEAEGG